MTRRVGLALAALLCLLPGAGRAGKAGSEEIAFWQAIQQSGNPAEYQAYLDAFPNGTFAPLARLRLSQSAAPAPAPVTSAPSPAAPPLPVQAAGATVWLRPTAAEVRLVNGVTLDLDAQGLRTSSNLRLAVVPADQPDAIGDPQRFAEDSTPINPARMHLTVPAGSPGRSEVRLYHIPRYAETYAVAARAAVNVRPGVQGATLARSLVREANRVGPVRFEANHRDRPMLIQAAFLRIRPRTDWNVQWFGGVPIQEIPRQVAAVSIGQPGVAPDFQGSLGEVVCVLVADDPNVLSRLADMQVGDPIVVSGIPTSWNNAGPADPVLLDRCVLRG